MTVFVLFHCSDQPDRFVFNEKALIKLLDSTCIAQAIRHIQQSYKESESWLD